MTATEAEGAPKVSERYFEDFRLGERFVSAGMTMTEAEIGRAHV